MKVNVPEHIKELVERIADEYEQLAREGDNEINHNYLFAAKFTKYFRKDLDNQELEPYWSFDKYGEYEIRATIMLHIRSFLSGLPRETYNRIKTDIYCDDKLKKAISMWNGVRIDI